MVVPRGVVTGWGATVAGGLMACAVVGAGVGIGAGAGAAAAAVVVVEVVVVGGGVTGAAAAAVVVEAVVVEVVVLVVAACLPESFSRSSADSTRSFSSMRVVSVASVVPVTSPFAVNTDACVAFAIFSA